jgi:hypothetical protein
MTSRQDGPHSSLFTSLRLKGNVSVAALPRTRVLSDTMRKESANAPRGSCVCRGIPFQVGRVVLAVDKPVVIPLERVKAPWLVFLHTTDHEEQAPNKDGFLSPTRGHMQLGVHVADYVFCYADGTEHRVAIRWRFQIGMFWRYWGEHCFEAAAHCKPYPIRTLTDQPRESAPWGWTQTRVAQPDLLSWVYWVWAFENPNPAKALVAVRVEPKTGKTLIAGISSGRTISNPLRWDARQKAVLRLGKGVTFDPKLDDLGLLKHIQLDLGQVISAEPRKVYPDKKWLDTLAGQPPEISSNELLVEYTAHPEARFHLEGGKPVPVSKLTAGARIASMIPIMPARQRVRLRVVEADSGKAVPVKLHIHGQAGEYLAPVDRHRIPNPHWFEDYSADYVGDHGHLCAYIPGETVIDLPIGPAFIEITKGFEIRPVRKAFNVSARTEEIVIPLEKVLQWRERGWVTADTHVHFLSPATARLEGAAEGVNVVNLLASQWGELMTNVGDFDGQTTFGSKEAGGDGEWLVRVGTENRQHVMGHISLLGYNGNIIAPMTVGGPDESALGDPLGILLLEWARLCRDHGGLVVIPHFPSPRAENAAAIIERAVDGIEMTSSGFHLGGINPYSLSDWYRYLNCGYFVPAVGGTDKMSASMLLGAIRTYARLAEGRPFDYEPWKDAVRSGNTFVTFGPLMEFDVEGKPPGSTISLPRNGGTLNVGYKLASVTIPMTRVELIVNGEIRESRAVTCDADECYWRVKVDKSSWLALLVRGQYEGKPEWIAAHSSPVMVSVEGSPFHAAADALTILEQIEGAMVFLDTLGTRADTAAYKRMRLALTSSYRTLHNRMHAMGSGHTHTAATDHRERHV